MSTATSLIGAIAVITAAAAVGYFWASAPPATLIPEFPASEAPSGNQADAGAATLAAAPKAAPPQLLVSAERVRQADQPAQLAISARGVGANVSVVIAGLAPGATMSAGAPAGPGTWQLPTADLREAAVMPPRGFVGVMNLTLELRLADGTV